jgi:hypothetical protein
MVGLAGGWSGDHLLACPYPLDNPVRANDSTKSISL